MFINTTAAEVSMKKGNIQSAIAAIEEVRLALFHPDVLTAVAAVSESEPVWQKDFTVGNKKGWVVGAVEPFRGGWAAVVRVVMPSPNPVNALIHRVYGKTKSEAVWLAEDTFGKTELRGR